MNRLERWSVVIGSFLVTVTGVANQRATSSRPACVISYGRGPPASSGSARTSPSRSRRASVV